MLTSTKMTTAEAVRYLRSQPEYAELIRDSYLGEDVLGAAEQFQASAEFEEVLRILGGFVRGGEVLDLGAGTGFASYALARCGAKSVYALEPDPSNDVGCGAIGRLSGAVPIVLLQSSAEQIPLADAVVDVVYARQVLHHVHDLFKVLRECARVLKRGGVFLACREHVVDSEEQLIAFLDEHPVHRLAGGENAFPLERYLTAIRSSGLRLTRVLDPWDTVINAFPTVRTKADLKKYPRTLLENRLHWIGTAASFLPGVMSLAWARIRQHKVPGRLYSFLAIKP